MSQGAEKSEDAYTATLSSSSRQHSDNHAERHEDSSAAGLEKEEDINFGGDDINVLDVINAMMRQRDLLLRRQAQMVDDFLKDPSDRYSGPQESDPVCEIRSREGPVKEMNKLSNAIDTVRKDLRKTRKSLDGDRI